MYVTRIELMAMPGRARELQAFTARVFDILKDQPGYLRGGLANSLGTPAKYSAITLWESQAAGETALRREAFQTFLAANPPTAFATIARPLEAFEVVHRVQDRPVTEAGHIGLVDITIDPMRAPAFENVSKELLDLIRRVGHGLISATLARWLSGGGRYLAVIVSTDREAAQRTFNAPEVQAWFQAHPLSEFGGAETAEDACAVVQVVVPAMVT